METMICECCSAKLVPTTLTPFITCEYCDSSVPNPYYDEKAAQEAAKPDAAAVALKLLREMGTAQKLASLDRDCFGDPIDGIDAARAGLAIPDEQQVYFLFSHTFLFVAFSDGLALTDGGVYYSCDNGKGSLSWESFITGAIACVDRNDGEDGALRLGAGVELVVKGDKDSRLARFLVDFHNQAYHQYTGETAPSEWSVIVPTATPTQPAQDSRSLLDSVLPGIGALLGSAVLGGQSTATRRTVVTQPAQRRQDAPVTKSAPRISVPLPGVTKRAPSLHPTSRPTVRQDRRDRVEQPRPLHSQPHHRPGPAGRGRPEGANRPGSNGWGRPEGSHRPGSNGLPFSVDKPAAAIRQEINNRTSVNRQANSMKDLFNAQKPGKRRR